MTEHRTLFNAPIPRAITWNSSGDLLAAGYDGRVEVASLRRRTDTGEFAIDTAVLTPFDRDVALAWRPETDWVAGVRDGRLSFWNSRSEQIAMTDLVMSGFGRLAWSADGQLLSAGEEVGHPSGMGIYRVSMDPIHDGGHTMGKVRPLPPGVGGFGKSNTANWFAHLTVDGELSISSLSRSSGPALRISAGAASQPAWSPAGHELAVTNDRTIKICDPERNQVVVEVNGHTSLVLTVAFAPDGRLLASAGWDNTIRLWATDDWRPVGTIELSGDVRLDSTAWLGLAFHPSLPLLCTVGTRGGVSLYELDVDGLLGAPAAAVKRYATAKVVLVGESGVGKTGLGYRLATGVFKEHASTHGQQFWVVDSLSVTREDGVRCNVVLWDLAGQPDYRLIHVLFLDDADLALVVLDASRRHELLDVATFWIRALEAVRPDACVKILVAGRTDRGNAAVSAEELREFASRLGVQTGFIETSARTGDGLPELAQVLREHLRWDDLPVVVETPAFTDVKAEVLRLKEQQSTELPLVPVSDVEASLADRASRPEIEASIRDLQLHGFVHLLRAVDGGQLILLRPELLNNLAASLILEARRNERGLGALDEAAVLANRYRFPELAGLPDEQRRVLAESAIVLFLDHNVCFREPLGEQVLLIFPELINEKPPALADMARFADDVTYLVTGNVENVYASLVVLLGYTNVLRRRDQWRDQARYELDGHLLHFRQERPRSDRLEIVLAYPDDVPASAKRVFQGLVEQFLRRRRVTVRAYPRVDCPECGYTLPRAQVTQFVDEGTGITYCPRGGHPIPLIREPERSTPSEQEMGVLRAETEAATERTTFTVVATQLRGYLTEVAGRRRPMTVFVSYAWGDRPSESWVRDQLVPDLEQVGIEVVLDRISSRVGDNLARFVEGIEDVDAVLVVATPAYARKYDDAASAVVAAEVEVINLRLLGPAERKGTVLPVLLQGDAATSLPTLMRTRIYGDFRDPARYFPELFELVLALHDLPPDTPALRSLRAAFKQPEPKPGLIPDQRRHDRAD